MTGKELIGFSEELEGYLSGFHDLLGRVENRKHFLLFARGQLGPVERKNLESIADQERVEARPLQYFFRRGEWDHEGVRARHQRNVSEQYGADDGIFVIDETSDGKNGVHTAGVGRQYSGSQGKIDNCIVSVHLAYVREEFHTILDGELFLPESWNPSQTDEAVNHKRKRCGIPDDVVHETKPAMSLRQLRRAIENGVPGQYVTADELYGRSPAWRRGVDAMNKTYVTEVPRSIFGWDRSPDLHIPDYKGKGRHPSRLVPLRKAQRLDVLLNSPRCFRFKKWKRFLVQETDKGPEVWEFKAGVFWEQSDPDQAKWLLVGRNTLTGEIKFWLSNAHPGTPLEVLIRVAFSRWPVERCFKECKSELGMDHAEIRNWKGLHRHYILTAVNHFFIMHQVRKVRAGGEKRAYVSPTCRYHSSVA